MQRERGRGRVALKEKERPGYGGLTVQVRRPHYHIISRREWKEGEKCEGRLEEIQFALTECQRKLTATCLNLHLGLGGRGERGKTEGWRTRREVSRPERGERQWGQTGVWWREGKRSPKQWSLAGRTQVPRRALMHTHALLLCRPSTSPQSAPWLIFH